MKGLEIFCKYSCNDVINNIIRLIIVQKYYRNAKIKVIANSYFQ